MDDVSPKGGGAARRCPNCGKLSAKETLPFCSVRCKQVDLGRWFGEQYTIPAVEIDDEFDEIEDDDLEGDGRE